MILTLLLGGVPSFTGLTVVGHDRTPSLVVNFCHPLGHATPVSPVGGAPLVPSRPTVIPRARTATAGVTLIALVSRAVQSPDPPPPKLPG